MNMELSTEMIGKKLDTTKIMIWAVVAAVSASLIAYTWASELDHTLRSYMLLNSLGYIGLLSVGVVAFTSKSYATYAPTGSRLAVRTIEFSTSDYARVRGCVERGTLAELRSIQRGEGVRMKLEMAWSKDRKFAAYQFFQYVSYEYAPAGPICYVEPSEAAPFGA